MAEIIRIYKEPVPAYRFIGKQYSNADRQDGNFGHIWGRWYEMGWFTLLREWGPAKGADSEHIGFMRCFETEMEANFEYWLGMFFPPGTDVPEGFDCIDLPAGELAVAWIKGDDDGELFALEIECERRFKKNGLHWWRDAKGQECFFERYDEKRFMIPDIYGNVILDYCTYMA